MREKRSYDRMQLGITVLVFFGGNDAEKVGEVTDISEDSIGLNFDITDEQGLFLKKRGILEFQFVDKYLDGSKEKTDVVQAVGLIKRLSVNGNLCHAGCVVRDEKYRKYVLRRELSRYFGTENDV
jgi:hypothetical protein